MKDSRQESSPFSSSTLRFCRNTEERRKALERLRLDVAKAMELKPNHKVLEVLSGTSNFGVSLVKTHGIKLTEVELMGSTIKLARRKIESEGLENRIEILQMDAASMGFPDETFDAVVNFLGWEWCMAISGEEAIEKALTEMCRVLKVGGLLSISFVPEERPKDEVSRFDRELSEHLWLRKDPNLFLTESFFGGILQQHDIVILRKEKFTMGRERVSPGISRGTLKWLCGRKELFPPNIRTPSYHDLTRKFGRLISKYGTKEISPVILLIGRKGC